MVLGKFVAEQPLFHRLSDIEDYLLKHSALLTQCWGKGIPVEGPDGVTSLLLNEHTAWRESSETPAALAAHGDDLLGPSTSGTTLTERALRRALVEDAEFVTSAASIRLVDVETVEGREEAIELACLSGCYVYQRFFARPAALLHRNPVFTTLHRSIGAFPRYFGKAQAACSSSGVVDPLLAEWVYPSSLVLGGCHSRPPFPPLPLTYPRAARSPPFRVLQG